MSFVTRMVGRRAGRRRAEALARLTAALRPAPADPDGAAPAQADPHEVGPDGVDARFATLLRAYVATHRGLPPDASTAPLLPLLPGDRGPRAAQVAVLCGAWVEAGADPGPLAGPALAGLRGALLAMPPVTSADPDVPVPDAGADPAADALMDRAATTLSWWADAVTAVLVRSATARRRVRDDAALVDLLTGQVGDLGSTAATDLLDLALAPEREPLLVLHPATGRGFRVEVDGVVDNFQLHTLLAGVLVGDEKAGLLPGAPPPARVLAAYGDPAVPPRAEVDEGWFELMQHTALADIARGEVPGLQHTVWHEGRPHDIGTVDGLRVLVLHTPRYRRSWSGGRRFGPVAATVALTGRLTPAEYATWHDRALAAAAGGSGTHA